MNPTGQPQNEACSNHQYTMRRLIWRSRRGLLELDLWLARFVHEQLPGLDDEAQKQFEWLLEYSDPDMMELLQGRKAAPDKLAGIISKIRQV